MRISVEAFVLSDQARQAVNGLAEDARLRRCQVRVHDGGLPEAPAVLARVDSPDVIILESDKPSREMLADLDMVADHVSPEARVLVIGIDDSIALYRHLLGMGVADYFISPVDVGDLVDGVLRTVSDGSDQNLAPMVAVVGVRGGVGSSALACNLGYRIGREVSGEAVLVDLDISAGTSAITLNLNPRQSVADVLGQAENADSTLMERYLQRYDDHLLLLGSTAQLDIAFRPSSDVLESLLNALRRQYDAVILDLPRQWSIWVRDVLLDATTVVLVAYPDLANLRDAQKMVKFLKDKRSAAQPTLVVLNKVGMAPKAELAAKDFEDVVGLAPAAIMPFEPVPFGQAMNNGEPVVKKGASKAFLRTMEQLVSALELDMKTGTRAARRARKGVLGALLKPRESGKVAKKGKR